MNPNGRKEIVESVVITLVTTLAARTVDILLSIALQKIEKKRSKALLKHDKDPLEDPSLSSSN